MNRTCRNIAAALSWWRVKAESSDLKVKLPHRNQREAAMDAAFVEDEVCIVLFSISTILYVHTVKP